MVKVRRLDLRTVASSCENTRRHQNLIREINSFLSGQRSTIRASACHASPCAPPSQGYAVGCLVQERGQPCLSAENVCLLQHALQ